MSCNNVGVALNGCLTSCLYPIDINVLSIWGPRAAVMLRGRLCPSLTVYPDYDPSYLQTLTHTHAHTNTWMNTHKHIVHLGVSVPHALVPSVQMVNDGTQKSWSRLPPLGTVCTCVSVRQATIYVLQLVEITVELEVLNGAWSQQKKQGWDDGLDRKASSRRVPRWTLWDTHTNTHILSASTPISCSLHRFENQSNYSAKLK